MGAGRTPLLLAGVLLALYVGAPATAAPFPAPASETAGAPLAAAPGPGTGVPSTDRPPAGTAAATSGSPAGGDHLTGMPGHPLAPLSARAREATDGNRGAGGNEGAGGTDGRGLSAARSSGRTRGPADHVAGARRSGSGGRPAAVRADLRLAADPLADELDDPGSDHGGGVLDLLGGDHGGGGLAVCADLPVAVVHIGSCGPPPGPVCVDVPPVVSVEIGSCRRPRAAAPAPTVRPTPTLTPPPAPTRIPTPRATPTRRPTPTRTPVPVRSTPIRSSAPVRAPARHTVRTEAPVPSPTTSPKPEPTPTRAAFHPPRKQAAPARERRSPLGSVLIMVVVTTLIASTTAVAFATR